MQRVLINLILIPREHFVSTLGIRSDIDRELGLGQGS